MSRTVSGTTTAISTPGYRTFKNEADYNSWLAAFSAQNEDGQRVIDFRTYSPSKFLEFGCTSDLKGRLYPHPCGPDLYLLDFIDRNGRRHDVTNLYVFPYIYPAAESESDPLQPMGSMQGRRGPVDLCTLTPGFEYEIRNAHQQRLKGISFIYQNRMTLEPRLQD